MIALAVVNTVSTTIRNHFYTFGGDLHRQKDGSAIGSDLSGEIARCVMGLWDIMSYPTSKYKPNLSTRDELTVWKLYNTQTSCISTSYYLSLYL